MVTNVTNTLCLPTSASNPLWSARYWETVCCGPGLLRILIIYLVYGTQNRSLEGPLDHQKDILWGCNLLKPHETTPKKSDFGGQKHLVCPGTMEQKALSHRIWDKKLTGQMVKIYQNMSNCQKYRWTKLHLPAFPLTYPKTVATVAVSDLEHEELSFEDQAHLAEPENDTTQGVGGSF